MSHHILPKPINSILLGYKYDRYEFAEQDKFEIFSKVYKNRVRKFVLEGWTQFPEATKEFLKLKEEKLVHFLWIQKDRYSCDQFLC